MLADVPEPWRSFLEDIDASIEQELERNIARDREDVLILAQAAQLDMAVLQERYHAEVRPFINGPLIRNDGTLAFWVEMINEVRQTAGSS